MCALEESGNPDYALSVLDILSQKFSEELKPESLGKMLVDYFIHGQNDLSNFEIEHTDKYIPVANKLLELGADINEQSISGHTALMRASMNTLPTIVLYLLSKGADPNVQSNEGNTALMYVCGLLPETCDEGDTWDCTPSHVSICESLLKAGSKKEIFNVNNITAAFLAEIYKSFNIVERLK